MMGPEVNRYGYMFVTDDGKEGYRYTVRAELASGGSTFVAGGATLNDASMVAEALFKTNAGNDRTTLTESKRFS